MLRGEVAIAGRVGRERLWDLAGAGLPGRLDSRPSRRHERIKNERRLAALGIARAKGPKMPWSRWTSARRASRPWSRA